MLQTIRRTAAALLALALLGPAAAADIIHYKDGRKLEGVITARTATEITVDTAFGTITVELSKIARIEEKTTPAQELAKRRAEIADDDAPALFQLAEWASEQDLRREARKLWREVIDADPGHRQANERLGRVEVEGVWMEPDEVDAYLEKVADEKRAQGLLYHEGEWLPEAEVMEKRGFVRYRDAWVPRREAETRQAVEDLAALDIEVAAVAGEFVTVFTSALDEEEIDSLIYDLDAMVEDFPERLGLDEVQRAQVLRYDVPIFVLPDQETSDRMVAGGFTRRFVHDDAALEDWIGERAYGLQWPRPLLVLVDGRWLDVTGERDVTRRGLLSHQLAELLVERVKGSRDAPGWAKAGLGAWYEGVTNYWSTVTLTSERELEESNRHVLWVAGWENFPEWRDRLREEGVHSNLGTIRAVMSRSASSYTSKDVGVCWSLVDFLLDRHATEFSDYLRVYDSEGAEERDPRRLHERAWERAFASTPDELQREWTSWALARPERFPRDPLGR